MPHKLSVNSAELRTNAVRERIESFRQAIGKAVEYLKSGKHADWHGFRPLFAPKFRNGEKLPPHKDWVKNVFLPDKQKSLAQAVKLLKRLSRPSGPRAARPAALVHRPRRR